MTVIDADHLTGSPIDPAKCPRIKSDGKQCGNHAGHRTNHAGAGYCWKHNGNTPSGQAHGAKLLALAAMPALGGEIDVNPLDAMLYTVRRASGMAAFYRLNAEALALEGRDPEPYVGLELQALDKMNVWADRSIKAGVAERQVRIAERLGERLSAAFEAAMGVLISAGVQVSADQRMLAVRSFSAELARHEGGGEIEATASDVT